ncbi:MAG: Peptide transporter permease, partial [Pseudomonadota bacterium]|nr:Peptide transporter permease [Pseudomonadota bacterium]
MQISDVIYLCLNLLLIYWIFASFKNHFNQKIWIKVFRQRLVSIALGILIIFWFISILDSIHIYHMSIIDKIFYPLNIYMEYSYSRPFDAYLVLPKVK